jgi:hypothetical protein
MIITVIVFVLAEVMFLVNLLMRGEKIIATTAMGFFWVLSGSLIPCMVLVAKLNGPLSPTTLGAVSNPFNWTIFGLWVGCNTLFVIVLSPKYDKGGVKPK